MYFIINFPFNNKIVLSSMVTMKGNSCKNMNLGDDLNYFLIKEISNKRPIFLNCLPFQNSFSNILCIGSILHFAITPKSIIWGSGAISENFPLSSKPKEVRAVRGPLTRDFLLKNDVECPEIYGDPALLLPIIFKPQKEKKYKIGIIPHFIDYDLPHVKAYRSNHPDILFIKMKGYSDWRSVINDICSCDFIISSSLHGLILSDAYNIPNAYVQFSNNVTGGEFKFKDYFAGVQREYTTPCDFTKKIDLDLLKNKRDNYKPINFIPDTLLKVCPFKLSKKYFK